MQRISLWKIKELIYYRRLNRVAAHMMPLAVRGLASILVVRGKELVMSKSKHRAGLHRRQVKTVPSSQHPPQRDVA